MAFSRAFTGIARKVTVFWVSRSVGAMYSMCGAPAVIHLRWVRARIASGHLHPQPTLSIAVLPLRQLMHIKGVKGG